MMAAHRTREKTKNYTKDDGEENAVYVHGEIRTKQHG